jgi:hypothetical protein
LSPGLHLSSVSENASCYSVGKKIVVSVMQQKDYSQKLVIGPVASAKSI